MVNKENISNYSSIPCTGCGVCSIVCPEKVITIDLNKDGFFAPRISRSCVGCGLCKEMCIKFIKNYGNRTFGSSMRGSKVYGGWSLDDHIRRSSSSGGLSHEIAKKYITLGYKISGVWYNSELNRTEHIIIQDEESIERIKGSKYLQSLTTLAFMQFSAENKYVVFGTPCQIYGLRKLIRKKGWEDNFILIDLFCHGVPSYNLWLKYLEGYKGLNKSIRVNFRDKTNGWRNFSIRIDDGICSFLSSRYKDLFINMYLSHTCLNKSCYQCLFRRDIIASDLRLGDFWGEKYNNDEHGVSIIVVNTKRGEEVLEKVKDNLFLERVTYNDLLRSQKIRFLSVPWEYNFVMPLLKSKLPLSIIYEWLCRVRNFYNKGNRILEILNENGQNI